MITVADLKTLIELGLVKKVDNDYELTAKGRG